jgi:hypothetical protein
VLRPAGLWAIEWSRFAHTTFTETFKLRLASDYTGD